MLFEASVRGEVEPKQSARFRQLPNGKAIAYQPAKVVRYTKSLREAFARQATDQRVARLDLPMSLELTVWVQRPISRARKHLWPDRRPDLDNLTKPVVDALQAASVVSDDSRICRYAIEKRYATNGDVPGIRVRLFALERPAGESSPFQADEPDLPF